MNGIIDINNEMEFADLLESDKPVLVDFWATWCGPCKMQGPVLAEFKQEAGDNVVVAKCDVDVNEKLATELGIVSIPTIMLFKDGELKEKTIGLTSKASLSQMVLKYLK
ncbi:MAG: thioredoxin [Clostridia bacterium]|nr:thioredoxin [Clostridia bacterium]